MKIDGSCHCGKITYRAEIDPDRVSICHCTDCQQLTGTTFRVSAAALDGTLEFDGEPKVYIKRTADSGNLRAQSFCGDCGSHLFVTSVGDGPKIYGIRLGTSRQFRDIAPSSQKWTRSALPWLAELTSLPGPERE